MRLDLEGLEYLTRGLIEEDGQIRLPKGMDRQLRDLMIENGPMAYLVAGIFVLKKQFTQQLLTTHMTTDEAIRKAIGTQGQLSGIDFVLQLLIEFMTAPPKDESTAQPAEDQNG
jgi:hypothetical protein